jgi:serine/threonine protein kinase
MLKALHYCHKVIGVVHRDIKPDNIMINKTGEAVLIDFGISAAYSLEDDDNVNELLNLKAGTYFFFAPELFKKFDKKSKSLNAFGSATDIWSLGITFYYLLTGQFPWKDVKSIWQLAEIVRTQEIDFDILPSYENTGHCIERMLDKNPDTRATIDELICMDWVTKCG